jgi:CheY-like chemotaxis protein
MEQKILVVDDSRTVCQAARYAFVASPFEVDIAHSAADASRMLRSGSYAAAVIDYVLPDETGVNLVRMLRSDAQLRRLPVVILHGAFHPFDPGEATRSGADALLVKPFRTDDILSAVTSAIAAAPARSSEPMHPMNQPVRASVAPAPPEASIGFDGDDDDDDDIAVIADAEPMAPEPPWAMQAPAPMRTPASNPPPSSPAPMAGAFRRVTTEAHTPAAPTPRRPPLAPPPPPSPLRAAIAPVPPLPMRPVGARSSTNTDDVAPAAYTPSVPMDSLTEATAVNTLQVQPIQHSMRPADADIVQLTGPQDVVDEPTISAPAPFVTKPNAFVRDDAPAASVQERPAIASSVPSPSVDAADVRAIVKEMLPTLVKDFLSTMLRQTGQKLEQYSQAKINEFVERDMPPAARAAIDSFIANELPTITRAAIDEALKGLVGEG